MVRIVEPLLGTRVEVAWTSATGDRVEEAIVDEVRRLESIFTVFEHSSALNDYVRTGSTGVPELRTVLDLATSWRAKTGGAFNPAVGPLMVLWDRAAQDGHVPGDAELRMAAAAASTASPDNLNGIAKGWIADCALQTCMDDTGWGWLSLGGDIVVRGSGQLRVGIEDPARPYDNVAPLATIELADEALATSGGARRFWTIDGVDHPKVLDPRTGRPVDRVASASVVAPTAAAADALATTALVLEPDAFLELVATEDAEALLVHRDGTMHATSDRFVLRPSPTT